MFICTLIFISSLFICPGNAQRPLLSEWYSKYHLQKYAPSPQLILNPWYSVSLHLQKQWEPTNTAHHSVIKWVLHIIQSFQGRQNSEKGTGHLISLCCILEYVKLNTSQTQWQYFPWNYQTANENTFKMLIININKCLISLWYFGTNGHMCLSINMLE